MIECYSRRSVQLLVDVVNDTVNKIVDGNITWTEDEKERYKRRIKEVYENLMFEYITIDGKPWSDQEEEEVTTEIETFDHKREAYLNTELIPQLDEALVRATEKRKTCPDQCTVFLARFYTKQFRSIDGTVVKIPSKMTAFGECEFHKNGEDLTRQTMKKAAENVAQLIKSLQNIENNAEGIKKVLED